MKAAAWSGGIVLVLLVLVRVEPRVALALAVLVWAFVLGVRLWARVRAGRGPKVGS